MGSKKIHYALSAETLKDIKEARNRKGLTQEQLADNIERTRATYLRLENGQSNVLSETMTDVCRELGLRPHVYVTTEDETEINVREITGVIKEKEAEIKALKGEIEALKKENESLRFAVELLKENRELRNNENKG